MKMTDIELLAIVQAHRADSLGVEDGELSNERAIALDRYHGRPYGNEMEGRSAIVSKDLSEAVDWAMPAIMRIFTQTGVIAEFDPISQEDEAQAEIETDYVNQVIMRDNNGWIVLHDAIKDTLLLKNGYVKHWWEETEKIEEPKYKGLVLQEVQQMLQDLQQDGATFDITGQEERQIETPQGPMQVFDLELKIKRKTGKVRIEAVPCEEIRVSRKCRGSLQDTPFVEHVTRKTRSDLIEMGMPREFVDLLPAYTETTRSRAQAFSRDSVSDESGTRYGTSSSFNDRSMDEIEYCEAYIRVDWDDDGVAELRKVVTVGNKLAEGDEWNTPIPEVAITGFVAKRVPHRHVGESLYDDLGDLQEIKTTIQRQLLDNIYLVNNSQTAINERCNVNDFLTSLPGGLKRVEGLDPVGNAFQPIVTPSIIGDILPVINYIDGIKESRTGITKASSGLDPETLSNVTKGAFLENMNRASQKVEMITRMIAETGVKEMVMRVHSLLNRYQDKQRIIRMKGKYVPVNPQGWRERTDVTVKVGLGTGNEETRQQKLMAISQMQRDMLAPLGLIEAKQAFALFSDISKTMGFDMPDKYAMSPDSPEYQQKMQNPQPDPAMQLEQMKQQGAGQLAQMKLQAEGQGKQADMQASMQAKQVELQATAQMEQVKQQATMQIEIEKLKMQAQLEREKMQMQLEVDRNRQEVEALQKQAEMENAAQLAAMKDQMDQAHKNAQLNHAMQLEEMKQQGAQQLAQMDAQVRLQIAQMQGQQAAQSMHTNMMKSKEEYGDKKGDK